MSLCTGCHIYHQRHYSSVQTLHTLNDVREAHLHCHSSVNISSRFIALICVTGLRHDHTKISLFIFFGLSMYTVKNRIILFC